MAQTATKWRPKDQAKTGRPRVLTAAAQRIDLDSKVEAQRQRLLRQNWQLQGWSYYDSIPEVGYAVDFIAHTAGRMRIFVAALSESGKSDLPIAIDDPELGAPQAVIDACTNALRDLGNGRIELANVMEAMSINTSVTGEQFLLGQDDPKTGVTTWSIRSIEEVVVYNDQVMLREGPMTNQGLLGLVPLDPDTTFVTRMWAQHPRFRLLAQSPMRRLANSCEDLLILRRIIRATGRSRLAGRGILFLPSQANLPLLNDDNFSQSGDDFTSKVMDAMITPIRNEGDASGVVPLIVEMDGEQIDHVKWIDFAGSFDAQAGAVREELIKVIATGLDIPAEVITGITDANHWCVDESTRIMTRHGWKRHDEVSVGDEVLTLNHQTGASEWQPIRDFYRAQVTDEPMVVMKGRDHSSMTTPNHRWPTVSVETGQRRWKTTDTLRRIDQIVTGTVSAEQPEEAKWSDALVELMGWYWTEGSQNGERVTIAQSHSVNPEKVARIRQALTKLYGPSKRSLRTGGVAGAAGWRESVQGGGLGGPVTVFTLNVKASRQLMELAPRKCVDPGFIQSLTVAQLGLFIDVSLQGDGHHYRSGRRDMFQSEPVRLDALELAGILAGYAVTRGDDGRRLNLSRKTTTRPVNSAHVAFRDQTGGAVTWLRPYTGTIWCPVTDNQTWLAQRDGTAYFTGNTAYQVSTDTFRQHIEPHVVTLVQMLTGAFLRPYFASCELDQGTVDAWVQRIVVWYDPTEAVTPTDLSKSAQELYALGVLSAKALRDYSGFVDEDAPSADEFLAWLISKQRTWPVNISEAVIHGLDPSLAVPPVVGPPALPGIKPGPGGGVVDVTPIATTGPALDTGGPPLASAPDSAQGMVGRLLWMMYERDRMSGQLALTAAAPKLTIAPSSKSLRISRQLAQGDRDLITRLHVAANDAMMRQLEKAGNRVRQKVNSDKTLKAKILHSHAEHVMMILGREAVERTGLTASNLMASEWDSLKAQYYEWTGQTQKAALAKAQQLANGDDQSTAAADAKLAAGLAAGWALLQSAMDTIAQHAAYNPDPTMDAEAAIAALNPDTIVPAGVVRAAIGVAGGSSANAFSLTTLANGATVPAVVDAGTLTGVGTGDTITGYLSGNGASTANYEWQHGSTARPFEPHVDLDGVQFDAWDSPLLANPGDWPRHTQLFPLDHDGCTCQVIPLWVGAGDVDAAEAALAGGD